MKKLAYLVVANLAVPFICLSQTLELKEEPAVQQDQNITTLDTIPGFDATKESPWFGEKTGNSYHLFMNLSKVELWYGKEDKRLRGIRCHYLDGHGQEHASNILGHDKGEHHQFKLNVEAGEVIVRVQGRAHEHVHELTFHTNKGNNFGPFGDPNEGKPFNFAPPKDNCPIIGFGIHEKDGSLRAISFLMNHQ